MKYENKKGRLKMGKMLKVEGIGKEDVTESMFGKWDKIIQYEIDNNPEQVKGLKLKVKGFYTNKEKVGVYFNEDIQIGIKSAKTREYVESKVISLEGLKELREIRNFYGRLKEKLELEEDFYIRVEGIKLIG